MWRKSGAGSYGSKHVPLHSWDQAANAAEAAGAKAKRRAKEPAPTFDSERAVLGLKTLLSETYGEAS